jgi:Fe-S cluster biogenesis protein NfuA
MDKKIPYIIYAESTPNPATMKFVSNILLMQHGATYESADINGNEVCPLAQALFNFSFVERVFIANNYVTITRTNVIQWEDIVHEVREFIGEYLNNGGLVFEGNEDPVSSVETGKTTFTAITKHREAQTDVEKNIIAILDEYVKPAVENDGGAILFDSYDNGKVNLILKGSCSGCPSSVMTLKSGVENLLKQMMPNDVEEVVALNG